MSAIAIGRLLAADGAEPTLQRARPARLAGRDRPASGEGSPGPAERYTVVPSLRAPRLLVPAGSRRHAVAAAGGTSQVSSWRGRLRQRATRACFAAGVGDLVFRDRLAPAAPATLARHLSELLGRPLRVGLRLGPPRANQKPVLVLLDRDAQVVGYAKLAENPLTRALLAVERAALAELDAARRDGADLWPLEVPQLRHAGRWHDADLLVVSALPVRGARSAATRRAAPVVAAAAAALARLRPTTVAPLAGSGYLRDLAGRVGALPEDRHRDLLRRLLDCAAAGDPALEYGGWHGDWFPGNMAVAGDRLLVWDWERYAAGVPVGFDALHHAFMSALLLRRRPLPRAASRMVDSAGTLLAPMGVPAAHAAPVAALYLVEIATRYRGDRNDAVDTRLSRPAQWLAPALASLGPPWRDCADQQMRRF